MGHHIRGFVAEADALRGAMHRYGHFRVAPLRGGLGFVPLTEALADEMDERTCERDDGSGREALAPEILKRVLLRPVEMRVAAELSRGFPLAYIETDYWGGKGEQFAMAWAGGCVVYGPAGPKRRGPINGALAALRVRRTARLKSRRRWARLLRVAAGLVGADEFGNAGLTHYRDMDDFEDPESACYQQDYLVKCVARERKGAWRTFWR